MCCVNNDNISKEHGKDRKMGDSSTMLLTKRFKFQEREQTDDIVWDRSKTPHIGSLVLLEFGTDHIDSNRNRAKNQGIEGRVS